MKKKNKIIVLGSAPNAKLPADGDVVYCANTAAFDYAREISHIKCRVNVVSGRFVVAGDHKRLQTPEVQLRYQKILMSRVDELVIIADRNYTHVGDLGATMKVEKQSQGCSIFEVLASDKRRLLSELSGFKEPIFTLQATQEIISLGPRRTVGRLMGYRKAIRRARLDDSFTYPVPFTVSTGIMSVMYALDRHGAEASYEVHGITLRANGNRYTYRELVERSEIITPHLYPDIRVMKALQKRYNISVFS